RRSGPTVGKRRRGVDGPRLDRGPRSTRESAVRAGPARLGVKLEQGSAPGAEGPDPRERRTPLGVWRTISDGGSGPPRPSGHPPPLPAAPPSAGRKPPYMVAVGSTATIPI